MRLYEPQLATKLDEYRLISFEAQPELGVGKKWNGFREVLYIGEERNVIVSRSGANHSCYLPHFADAKMSALSGTVFDCEAVTKYETVGTAKSAMSGLPESAIAWQREHGLVTLAVFDCLAYRGEDISSLPLSERVSILSAAFRGLPKELPFVREQLVMSGKYAYYKSEIKGGEGVVVKDLTAPYAEGRRAWYKVKKHQTWDVVVMGFTSGTGKYSDLIGAIIYGACDSKGVLQIVGKCSGMTDDERTAFARRPDDFVGRVIEVEGFELGEQGAIVHPSFQRFRDDKSSKECLLRDM